jgi:hypothetical protein
LRKSFRVSFDEKLLLWFWSVDAAPGSSLVDLHDALSAHAKCLAELRQQAVALIFESIGLSLDAIVGQAPDDEPGLLSRELRDEPSTQRWQWASPSNKADRTISRQHKW